MSLRRLRPLAAAVSVSLACSAAAQRDATSSAAAAAGGTPFTAAISQSDLRARLFTIAHDSMLGRNTGSVGHLKTVEYIAAEMRRLGLQPGGESGSYFQDVPFVRRTLGVDRFLIGGETLRAGVDYAVVASSVSQNVVSDAGVVFGGTLNDTASYISAESAAGKVVIFRQPPGEGGIFLAAANLARFRDAAALAITGFGAAWPSLARQLGAQSANLSYRGAAAATVPTDRPASLFLSDALAERLLGRPVAAATPGQGGAVHVSAEWRLEELPAEPPVRNVIAVLPGSDPALRGQYVVIGSHSDHVGVGGRAVEHDSARLVNVERRRRTIALGREPSRQEMAGFRPNLDSIRALRPPRMDSIFNGADDDGSGTVAMIEIAEAMAASPRRPRRSIVFVWHAADERGLIGADHWTRNPTLPRDSIVAMLNMDMIGRGGPGEEVGGGPTYLQLIGWRRLSSELGDLIDAVNRERRAPFVFDLQYDAAGHPEQYYCRSDHYMYARYGVPVVFFSTGDHADYHQVTDEPQYIDYAKLRDVTQFIHDVALRAANLPQRLRVDGPRPDPNGQCVQ